VKRGLGQAAVQVVLIGWTLIVVVPFILILLLAFRTNKDIFAYPLGIGGDFTLANFAAAWKGPVGGSGLTIYFQNTLVIAITSLLTTLCAGLPAAFFSTTLSPRALRWFLRLFLVAAIVPLILLVIPYFQIFDRASLLNSPVMVGITYGVIVLPTTVLILHSFFVDFPNELVEAASLDGLGHSDLRQDRPAALQGRRLRGVTAGPGVRLGRVPARHRAAADHEREVRRCRPARLPRPVDR
jgi:ABC-type glycerol-3-phosphate transport system permease component